MARQLACLCPPLHCPLAHPACASPTLEPLQIYREGQGSERLFDLQTLERKRVESFEKDAKWERSTSATDLQVGPRGVCRVRQVQG